MREDLLSPADDPELGALLAGVVAGGADLLPWLVLADWLDDHGRHPEAEVTRLRCRLIETCLDPNAHPGRAAWQARMVDLLCGGVEPCVPRHTVDLGGGVAMGFVWVPPGTFLMGSPAGEKGRDGHEALHEVTLTRGFWLGATAVTQAQYRAVTGEDPSEFKGDDRPVENVPVENVSWEDAVAFAAALSRRAGSGEAFRLPTEAEWEWACRAGTTSRFWNGDGLRGLGRVGWHRQNSGEETHPVGSKRAPNPLGLHDMHGNVLEWCSDWYEGRLEGPMIDPAGPAVGSERVLRGGGWGRGGLFARSAYRFGGDASDKGDDVGFRIARVAPAAR